MSGSNRLKSQINVLTNLGSFAVAGDMPDEARRLYALALDLARNLKDVVRESNALINRGEVEFGQGATAAAIEFVREATSSLRAAGENSYLARALTNLGEYLILSGDLADGRTYAHEALSLLIDEGGFYLRVCVQLWALIAALEGRYAEAAQLKAWIDAEHARTGEIREPTEQQIYDLILKLLAANLTPDALQSFAAEGARWSEDHAVDFALRRIVTPENPAP